MAMATDYSNQLKAKAFFEVRFLSGFNASSFWLQVEGSETLAQAMELDLAKAVTERQDQLRYQSLPEIGTVLAIHDTDEECYFRAKVEPGSSEELVIASKIDHGHEALVHLDDVYSLPSNFVEIPAFAYHCRLKNVGLLNTTSDNRNGGVQANFTNIFTQYKVLARFRTLDGPAPGDPSYEVELLLAEPVSAFLSQQSIVEDDNDYIKTIEQKVLAWRCDEEEQQVPVQTSNSTKPRAKKSKNEINQVKTNISLPVETQQDPPNETVKVKDLLKRDPLLPGSTHDVLCMGNLIRPDSFFLGFFNDPNWSKLHQGLDSQDYLEDNLPSDAKPGSVFLVQRGKEWARAELRYYVKGDRAQVFFIDEAKMGEINLSDAFVLPSKLKDVPLMAVKAKLYAIQPPSGASEYSQECCDLMTQVLKSEEILKIEVYQDDRDCISVDIVLPSEDTGAQNMHLTELLVSKGLAESNVGEWDHLEVDHFNQDQQVNPLDALVLREQEKDKGLRICPFIKEKGFCYKGKSCQFLHDLAAEGRYEKRNDVNTIENRDILATLEPGAMVAVDVSFVYHPDRFYIRLLWGAIDLRQPEAKIRAAKLQLEQEENLETLTQAMTTFYKGKRMYQAVVKPFIKDNIYAVERKGLWYRARFFDDEQDMAEMFFVDFGFNELVPHQRVRNIEPRFMCLPLQAVPCSLFPIQAPKHGNRRIWSYQSIQTFLDMVKSRSLFATIYKVGDAHEETVIDLHDDMGGSLCAELVAKGMAEPIIDQSSFDSGSFSRGTTSSIYL